MNGSVGSLFSGPGGLDLGLHYAGLEVCWACENNRHARAIFQRHWAHIPIADDVRAIDQGFPRVDVLAGGFPCQDVSVAGYRAGVSFGTRSSLWREFARAIRLLRPRVALVENVPGLLTAGFGIILTDLAEAGYDARWCSFRASDFGAPHRRERVFVVATDTSLSGAGRNCGTPSGSQESLGWGASNEAYLPVVSGEDPTSHSGGERYDWRFQRGDTGRRFGTEGYQQAITGVSWGAYEPAIRRWEHLTRPAPRPTDDRDRLDPPFVEWMLGFPDGWTDNVSRAQRLKHLGNSVQIQAAELVGLAIVTLLGGRTA